MLNIRAYLALWLSKICYYGLRMMGREGGHLPGVIALRIYPDILSWIATPKKKIGITGTNGKSSLTALLHHAFSKAGYSISCNLGGSNLEGGAVTTLIKDANFFNQNKKDFLLLEVDELSAYRIVPKIKMDQFLLLNLFTDQYDRIAYESYLARKIKEACIDGLTLILNAQDPYQPTIVEEDSRVLWYGLKPLDDLASEQPQADLICPHCHLPLTYDHTQYQSIGFYHCPHCQATNPEMDLVVQFEEDSGLLDVDGGKKHYHFTVHSQPPYQLYNQAALIAVCLLNGIEPSLIQQVLDQHGHAHASYNRRQIADYDISQQIVKFRTAIPASEFLKMAEKEGPLSCVLIDQELDGNHIPGFVDLSWIYDIDFDPLHSDRIRDIVLCGSRYRDFAIAFISQGIDRDKIHYVENTKELSVFLRQLPSKRIMIGYDLNGGHHEEQMIAYRLELMFKEWEESLDS